MGLFCVNFHFRNIDDKSLPAALARHGIDRHFVLPAKNGWTSLYEEQASHQDERRIRSLGGDLTRDLKTSAIAFMVHDSDIACYWFFDQGQLVDEYNSCPDCFDDDGGRESSPSGGDAGVLLRYCREGVRADQLIESLRGGQVFAENTVERLAEALGIDCERALSDYRDMADGDGPNGSDDFDGDDDGGGEVLKLPRAVPKGQTAGIRKKLAQQMANLIGGSQVAGPVDPNVAALVKAAANEDLETMDRLLKERVSVDADAPIELPIAGPASNLGEIVPGGAPKMAISALFAALAYKRKKAVKRLLEAGTDANRVHPVFGPPVHVAVGAGDVELLQLLIDHGADVMGKNLQGQTALDILALHRIHRERLEQAWAAMKSLGAQMPEIVDQFSKFALPNEGWDACERLLRARSAT